MKRKKDCVRYDNNDLQVFKFRRTTFGANATATIETRISKYRKDFPSAVQMLDICINIDDLSSKEDVAPALHISITAEKVMKGAGMSLRKWISNSNEVMKKWDLNSYSQKTRKMDYMVLLDVLMDTLFLMGSMY